MPNQPKRGADGEPLPRGGRRGPPRQMPEASLRNLKKWAKGESGNPSGRPKSLVEISRLARSYAPEAIEKLRSIMLNNRAPYRDQIQAALAILDRGLGRPIAPIFRGANGLPDEMIGESDGAEGDATALLRAVQQEAGQSLQTFASKVRKTNGVAE